MDQQEQRNELDKAWVERAHMMVAVANTDAGLNFLRWLCHLTTFNRITMSMDDAVKRDIWMQIRQYIPVDRLGAIEHMELREKQERIRRMFEELEKENDNNVN